jgi:uncharacterized protein YciI
MMEKPMPLFAVLFQDDESRADEIRRMHMQAHLAFLERHAAKIKAAGPLRSDDGNPAGGLWIVEAPDAATVQDLVKEDPFWPTGLRRAVNILAWQQVFAEGVRKI